MTASMSFPFKNGFANRDDVKKEFWVLEKFTHLAFNSIPPKFNIFLCRQTIIQITHREVEDDLR